MNTTDNVTVTTTPTKTTTVTTTNGNNITNIIKTVTTETITTETVAKDPEPGLYNLPPLMTVPQLSKYLAVSDHLLYSLCAREEIRHIKIGRCIRIPREAVQELLPKITRGAKQEASH